MRRFGKGAAAMIAGAGLVLASVAPAAAASPAGHEQKPKAPVHTAAPAERAYPRVWLNTWTDAPSYWSSPNASRAGTLHAGSNYFYCQAAGTGEVTVGGYRNYYWALTDDDSGNRNVWVSDVYITTGDNDEPVPGLPIC